MRISDWSSDVCSSDLLALIERTVIKQCASPNGLVADPDSCGFDPASLLCNGGGGPNCLTKDEVDTVKAIALGPPAVYPGRPRNGFALTNPTGRAEEHTSELQSLMRNTSTVLCLKTK